jgi:hypothetical protein
MFQNVDIHSVNCSSLRQDIRLSIFPRLLKERRQLRVPFDRERGKAIESRFQGQSQSVQLSQHLRPKVHLSLTREGGERKGGTMLYQALLVMLPLTMRRDVQRGMKKKEQKDMEKRVQKKKWKDTRTRSSKRPPQARLGIRDPFLPSPVFDDRSFVPLRKTTRLLAEFDGCDVPIRGLSPVFIFVLFASYAPGLCVVVKYVQLGGNNVDLNQGATPVLFHRKVLGKKTGVSCTHARVQRWTGVAKCTPEKLVRQHLSPQNRRN